LSDHLSERKFPIGPFRLEEQYTSSELEHNIDVLGAIPAEYRQLVGSLSDAELAKTYREASWNVRQLVHHVADIQYLHYFRMKKVLTEPDYKIQTLIDMNAWAMTPDSLTNPVSDSLQILDGVTARYVNLVRSLSEEQLALSYFHPLRQIWFNQKQALAMSAWHVRHHLEHIRLALS